MLRFVLLVMFMCAAIAASWAAPVISTLDEQDKVEVTVYNSNIGLVKDTRHVTMPFGVGELRFMDVASGILPYTVHVESLDQSDFAVLEQNYEFDLMNSAKLMDKYVGRDVKIERTHEFQGRKEIVNATLLSNNNGPIYRIDNEIHLGAPGIVVLPEIPENLVAKPTLTWIFKNKNSKPQNLQVSYLTNGITWRADYVLVVNKDDTQGDLNGWVTLDNTSGATYKNAKLKLVAGEVNRVYEPQPMRHKAMMMEAAAMASDNMMQAQGFFEYHLYDLPNPTTIKDNQSKQLALLQGNEAKITKEFVVSASALENYFWGSYGREGKIKLPVDVKIKFKNSKDNHLGMPLPKGTVRLYKEDQSGSQQFIGEDAIDHTPKDEDVELKVGQAFDIVAESRQTDFKQIDSWTFESEWEITLRNHKEMDVDAGVVAAVSFGLDNFKILTSTHPHKKLNTSAVRFDVHLPKDQEVVLKYRVQVKRG